jgi:S-adenosyl-L-methionine hydrolase (adenosine-forming)
MAQPPIVTLTTDFGLADSYVGIIKGVILGICPNARLVDLSHLVPPQDIATAALLLRQAAPYFPADTIHLAVVDPGVGGSRLAVAVGAPSGVFVAPDNGLLTAVLPADLAGVRAVHLNQPRFWLPTLHPTFHGRDIFAPVAAHLAAGVPLLSLGQSIRPQDLVRLPWPIPTVTADQIVGEVIHTDHFGNLITNIDGAQLTVLGQLRISLAGADVGALVRTYSDRGPGEPAAYIGSSGLLEIAVVECNAAQVLGAGRGAPVMARSVTS